MSKILFLIEEVLQSTSILEGGNQGEVSYQENLNKKVLQLKGCQNKDEKRAMEELILKQIFSISDVSSHDAIVAKILHEYIQNTNGHQSLNFIIEAVKKEIQEKAYNFETFEIYLQTLGKLEKKKLNEEVKELVNIMLDTVQNDQFDSSTLHAAISNDDSLQDHSNSSVERAISPNLSALNNMCSLEVDTISPIETAVLTAPAATEQIADSNDLPAFSFKQKKLFFAPAAGVLVGGSIYGLSLCGVSALSSSALLAVLPKFLVSIPLIAAHPVVAVSLAVGLAVTALAVGLIVLGSYLHHQGTHKTVSTFFKDNLIKPITYLFYNDQKTANH